MAPKAVTGSLLGHYAGFVSRALAFIIDAALIGVTLIFVSWMASVLGVHSVIEFLFSLLAINDHLANILFGPVVASILTSLFILGYHIFFMILTGQTPGKAMIGLRVVRMDGRRLNAWRAFVRIIGYLISMAPLCLGFIWVIIDDRRQAWHDKIAGTCVIYTWAARPDERFLVEEMNQLHTDARSKK